MPNAYLRSLDQCDVIQVAFLKPAGGEVILPLLVDSGFTGQSSFVLPVNVEALAQAAAPASQTAGALSGIQRRVVVTCRIPGLSFLGSFTAILADTSSLALPPGIEGMAGLRFLRHFRRWGAERANDSSWRFFLSGE